MVLLQRLPVAGFLNKNVKMSQDNSARIYQDRLQDKSVIMCQDRSAKMSLRKFAILLQSKSVTMSLLRSVIMFLALFPGKNA